MVTFTKILDSSLDFDGWASSAVYKSSVKVVWLRASYFVVAVHKDENEDRVSEVYPCDKEGRILEKVGYELLLRDYNMSDEEMLQYAIPY